MKRERNSLIQLVEQGVVPLGIQCFTGHPALIEILGATGYDFIMICTEHTGLSPRALEDTIRAAEVAGLVPLVRVPDKHDEADIRRALEAGAMGLVVPQIRNAADMRAAIDAAQFPPQGSRGMCPSIRAAGYALTDWDKYVAWNNSEVLIIPLIEHPEAVANIEEICALKDVRMLIFGPGDFGQALGLGMQMLNSDKIRKAFEHVVAVAKKHDVLVIGGPAVSVTPDACRKAVADGVRLFLLGLDTLGFRQYCEQTVRDVYRGLEGSGLTRPTPPVSGFKLPT
jgi:2-keto-3-deoxy-L-rhamnonate aldolase RhmA